MFIDYATCEVRAGDGGNGCISFRREKFVPKGGPDGGDGGHGGSVYALASASLKTLADFRYKRHYRADNGKHGQGSNWTGRSAHDLVIKLPCGTVIKDKDSGEVLADLVDDGDKILLAEGGRGGRGNARFATSTRQAPRMAEEGRPGQRRLLVLELKLIAEVGLIGLPNAGKSTLLAHISKAKPKIADYPFTTLVPNLGVVEKDGEHGVVVADIPGLIEGAHQGVGLGDRFLRHIERTRTLVHLIGLTSGQPKDWLKAYETINKELKAYSPELAKRPQIVLINKVDLPEVKGNIKAVTALFARKKIKVLPISAATGQGLDKFLNAILYDKIKDGE